MACVVGLCCAGRRVYHAAHSVRFAVWGAGKSAAFVSFERGHVFASAVETGELEPGDILPRAVLELAAMWGEGPLHT